MVDTPTGPVSTEVVTNIGWQARKEAAIARGEGNLNQMYVERARNAELWDVEGRRYIDFGSGIAVCNTGHSHPRIVEAVKDQVDRFSHTCVMVTPYDTVVRLAERLNEVAPGSSPKKSMFVTTGAEAVENAVKIARSYTGRRAVIAFNGGYHGRTNLTLGLTGKNAPYKNGFGPFPGDIYRATFPIDYHGISEADAVAAIQTLFDCDVAPEDVAALIIEPVQGEGGFYPASNSFMQAIRAICDTHGIVMISDEIQTGFGRTGRMFCTEYSGVEPDLITIAKGMAGGFPIAAVVGKVEIMDAPGPGGLGGTYAGSPIGCTAALEVLDIIEEEKLVEAALNIGAVCGNRLRALQTRHPEIIGDIRTGRGAMMAIEFVHEGDATKPNTDFISPLISEALERGLILLKCGSRGNVIRFLPALTIEPSVMEEGLDIFEQAFEACLAGQALLAAGDKIESQLGKTNA